MPARTRKIRHDDETRAKIKVSQLANRLTNHALGVIELSQTQVRAIEILLRKVLPDLAAIEHSGDVETSYVVRMPEPVKDMAEWSQRVDEQEQALSTPKDLTTH